MTAVWSYCVVMLLGALCYYLSGWFRAVRFALQMPGPPAIPILGNALLITNHQKLEELGKNAYKYYGYLFRGWATVLPLAVMLSPEHIQVVLSSHKNTEKIYFYSLLHNFLGQGLITSSGNKWRFHRKVLQPSFHLSVLEGFIGTFYDSAQVMVKKLTSMPDLTSVNITSTVNQCVLNILHEAVLGIPVDADNANKSDSPYRQGKLVAPYRIVHPWLLVNWIYRLTDIAKNELQQQTNLIQFTSKIVNERRKIKQDKQFTSDNVETSKRKSFVDFMVEVSDINDSFTEEDVVHELCTLMLAGQDSVGAAFAFCLYELARNPEIQELVFQELDSVFGEDERAPTMSDLRQLKYLEQCVKETLRLYPSVPIVFRTLTEDIDLGKHIVPAGCGILISPYATHRLPHIYPDPEKFDPDRFLPDKVERRHPYAYLPFSAGPRNCIGHRFAMMELKTVISTVLRSYRLSVVPGHETLKLNYRITMRATGGIWLNLTHRHRS